MRINDCYKREICDGIDDRIGIILPKFESGDPIRLTITSEDGNRIDTVDIPSRVVYSIKEWLFKDEAINNVRYYMRETEEEDREATDADIEENMEDIVEEYYERHMGDDGTIEAIGDLITWTLGL